MVNTVTFYMGLLPALMKVAGVRPQQVEIEPGTTINFWVPSKTKHEQSKPAVVFLHGFVGTGILTWHFQVLALAKKYAIYVPDLLFFGKSITDKINRSPAFQADCMAKALRKLGVEKCTLVGFSYGGMVSFKMAELFPYMVHSMVIDGSVIALTESRSHANLERIGSSSWAEYLIPNSVKGVKKLLGFAFYKLPWIPNFVYQHILKVMFDNRKERKELLEAVIVRDEDVKIPRYSQRIHIIWGENDKILALEDALNMKEQLGGIATLHTIKKAGHLVNVERPKVFNRHLKKILASLYED